jgi:hypothetical protein
MKKVLIAFVIISTSLSFAQVGISTTNPNPSSALDITSSDSGLLIPRVSLTDTSDATTITNGNVESLLIYNIATISDVTPGFYYWNSSQWVRLINHIDNNTDWSISGNSGTTNGTDFIGTTDDQNIDIRVNNIIKHRFTRQGQIEVLNTGNSVFIGQSAGANDDLTENQNVFVGTNSGVANTSGFSNSFYGHNSGRFNTTGSSNSFFGENSGLLNTIGDANSFFGQDSGASNTIGTRNSFFGQDSGFSNTSGINNSFFGENSGINNTIGSRNSFFGQASGFTNTEGVDNSFYGNLSGFANTTGNNNSFYGVRSGVTNTRGGDNSFFGFESGISNTTGSRNSFLGSGSGANATGNGNIFIGFQAGQDETGDGLLYIENSSVTTPLIWGNFTTDLVGINRVATTNTLEVGGEASKATAGNWLANSDSRLKKNIKSLNSENVLQQLLSLKGITYEWNDNQTGNPRPKGIQYGFTAQNIKAVYPELVSEDNQGYLQTAYGTYDAMTVEAMRALYNRVVELENENRNLKIENQGFENRLLVIEILLNVSDKSIKPQMLVTKSD